MYQHFHDVIESTCLHTTPPDPASDIYFWMFNLAFIALIFRRAKWCMMNRLIDHEQGGPTHIFQNRLTLCTSIDGYSQKNLCAHCGCVNAISFNKDESLLVSGGDDKRLLLWNIESVLASNKPGLDLQSNPVILTTEHNSNIFTAGFTCDSTTIFSSGNDAQIIVHDVESLKSSESIQLYSTCFHISAHPTSKHHFTSAGEDGKLLVHDLRVSLQADAVCLAVDCSSYNFVEYNPIEPTFVISSSASEGVQLWDVRKPKWPLLKYFNVDQCKKATMCCRWDGQGRRIVSIGRNQLPHLHDATRARPLVVFDNSGYWNSCTMKSCCFAGHSDQYVVSGSDDFRLYQWQIPTLTHDSLIRHQPERVGNACQVFEGHRSIVNQVRYSRLRDLLISSGVEKIIKIWSKWELNGAIIKHKRALYSNVEYLNFLVRTTTDLALPLINSDEHVVSLRERTVRNTDEDLHMLAYFDSLIQKEIEESPDESESIKTNQSDMEFEDTSSSDSSEMVDGEEGYNSAPELQNRNMSGAERPISFNSGFNTYETPFQSSVIGGGMNDDDSVVLNGPTNSELLPLPFRIQSDYHAVTIDLSQQSQNDQSTENSVDPLSGLPTPTSQGYIHQRGPYFKITRNPTQFIEEAKRKHLIDKQTMSNIQSTSPLESDAVGSVESGSLVDDEQILDGDMNESDDDVCSNSQQSSTNNELPQVMSNVVFGKLKFDDRIRGLRENRNVVESANFDDHDTLTQNTIQMSESDGSIPVEFKRNAKRKIRSYRNHDD